MKAQPAEELGKFFGQSRLNAIQVLINACNLAQSRGAFTLGDSAAVHRAVSDILEDPKPQQPQQPEEPPTGSE